MPFADLHCDTIAWLRQNRLQGRPMALLDAEPAHINLQKLRQSGYFLQNFALFVNLAAEKDPFGAVLHLAEIYTSEMEKNADLVRPCLTFADMESARAEGKLAAILTVEEGGVFGGDLTKLRTLHRLGMRMLTLTWNHENELGHPNGTRGGLKPKGMEFLAEMERLGVIPDVSHLNEDGFWDVCRLAKRPFCASHSSCHALHPHPRNLTDPQLKALADRGGLVGVNFYSHFLTGTDTTRTADIVAHIRHMRDAAGLDVIALGSDFDGIDCPLELTDAAGMPQLIQALDRAGFPEHEIDAITWKNVWNFYQRTL